MVKRTVLGMSILFLSLFSVFSEIDLDATLTGIITASKVGDGKITSSGLAKGNFTIKSTGSRYVKSQLTLDFVSIRNMGVLSISKAWVKFRYPLLRVTLGKNRISWGEGAAFNAGDVIFDDYITPGLEVESVDLTADELRSVNRTMVHVTFPLGRFTFVEGIYLPYDFPLYVETKEPYYNSDGSENGFIYSNLPDYENSLEISQHSVGGRFVTKAGGIKLETGYIYNGKREMHKPYVSFNGTLGVDYHGSASINIHNGDIGFASWKKSLKISTGSFYLFDLENDRTLTLRLEALVKPFGDWELDALMLYPEISLIPNDELALFVRAIINPLDVDTTGTIGLNWKTYQGFSIGTFFTAEIVENTDPEMSFTVIVTHKF